VNDQSDVTSSITFGIIFVVIGGLVLLNEFDILTLSWGYIVPIVLIIAGIAVIVSSQVGRRSQDQATTGER
jgi:hypothetical protein